MKAHARHIEFVRANMLSTLLLVVLILSGRRRSELAVQPRMGLWPSGILSIVLISCSCWH